MMLQPPRYIQAIFSSFHLQSCFFVYVYTLFFNHIMYESLQDRNVKLTRQKVGGLGLSIKGGYENKLPILVSRIFKDQAGKFVNYLYVYISSVCLSF